MSKGTFQIISESYQIGANNLIEYCDDAPLILKPFFYIYAIIGYLSLYICSFIFYLLIIFDYFSSFINSIRKVLLDSIEDRSINVDTSLINFLFNPIIIAALTPIFIISGILPKISSELDIDEYTGEVIKNLNITGSGTFKKIINFSMETTSNLFNYLRNQNFLTWPFLIIPCLFNAFIMFLIILVSTPLLILDLFSHIVDSIRAFCIKTSRNLGQSTYNGIGGFLFSPIVLIILVPIFIGILIIPKFSTAIDGID